MNIRAKFEEIWPVPDVIFWSSDIGRYAPMPDEVLQYERLNEQWAHEHNARLDTFTRCQETTDVYVSLVDELVQELELAAEWVEKKKQGDRIDSLIDRAKQIMEQKK